MVMTPQTQTTSFKAAYDALNEIDKPRLRGLVCMLCDISEKTFYDWLKDLTLISPSHRWCIAQLFNQEVQTLFKTSN